MVAFVLSCFHSEARAKAHDGPESKTDEAARGSSRSIIVNGDGQLFRGFVGLLLPSRARRVAAIFRHTFSAGIIDLAVAVP